eukprot:Skav206649  [mRNA]  locus=scaffold1933:22433:26073:+ [translate_table: standard]
MGCAAAEELHLQLTGYPLPPTFTETTRNDVAIFSPELAPLLQKVGADDSKPLAGHNPLMFQLRCNGLMPTRTFWPLPQPWIMLEPDLGKVAEVFQWDATTLTPATALRDWSQAVEQAIDVSLRHSQADGEVSRPGLPPQFQGRCTEFVPCTVPFTGLIKPGRHDDFSPKVDQPTHLLKAVATQIRRIKSLIRRSKVLCEQTPERLRSLYDEWKCIRRSRGCRQYFWDWLMSTPELYPVPLRLPSLESLSDLHQLLEHHVNQLAYQHHKRRDHLAIFLRERDIRKGKKQVYQSIREPSPGLVEHLQEFFGLVVCSRRAPQTILGPAAALSFHLAKLGWQLTRQGMLLIDAFYSLDLLYANWQDIVSAINKLGKHAVALQLSGAVMSADQKVHFLDDAETCPFCGEPDSKEHQLLHCASTAVMRGQHDLTCTLLADHDDIYIHQPGVFRTPHFECIRAMQRACPEADVVTEGAEFGFFTDGSCQQPTSVQHRWAAYAIVYPIHPPDQIVADAALPIDVMLTRHFAVAGVALLPGHQTIDRAELLAVVQVHERGTDQPVYADSAYVLSRFALLQRTLNISLLHKSKNFDLLRRWHVLIWTRRLRTPTLKVQAHQPIPASTTDDTWLRIGNAVADLAAKQAAFSLLPSYVDLLQTGAQEELRYQDFF